MFRVLVFHGFQNLRNLLGPWMLHPSFTPVLRLPGQEGMHQRFVPFPEECIQGMVRFVEIQGLRCDESFPLVHRHHHVTSVVGAKDQLVVLHGLLGVLVVLLLGHRPVKEGNPTGSLHTSEPGFQVEGLDHLLCIVPCLTCGLRHDGQLWLTEDIDSHTSVFVKNIREISGRGVETHHRPLRPVLHHEPGLDLRRQRLLADGGLIFR